MSTEPLTPPDCDLRGMPFMPLLGERLIESDLFFVSTGDEFKAAVALWWASWKQVPAASLPTDDRVLAGLARLDAKRWAKVKANALHGFVSCSDGRLYHPVVAEVARDAWEDRQLHREAKDNEAERKRREREERSAMFARLKAAGEHLPWNTPTGELRTRCAQLASPPTGCPPPDTHPSRGQVPDGHGADTAIEGTGTGTGITPPERAPSAQPNASRPDPNKEAWDRGVALLAGPGGAKAKSARSLIGRLLRDNHLEARDLLPSIVRAEATATPDPQSYLTAAARALAKAPGSAPPEPPAAYSDERWGICVETWSDSGRWGDTLGPPPDQPGTLVPRHILEHHGVGVVIPLRREIG